MQCLWSALAPRTRLSRAGLFVDYIDEHVARVRAAEHCGVSPVLALRCWLRELSAGFVQVYNGGAEVLALVKCVDTRHGSDALIPRWKTLPGFCRPLPRSKTSLVDISGCSRVQDWHCVAGGSTHGIRLAGTRSPQVRIMIKIF